MQNIIYLEHTLPGSQAASGKKQRVYIFLTRHGFFFCIMLFGMLLGAVNYNNSMAYLLVFLLTSLFMVCLLHTYRNMRGIVVSLSQPGPVFAGDIAHFPLLINNHGWQTRIGLKLQPWPRKKGYFSKRPPEEPAQILNLHTDSLLNCEIKLATTRRGYFPLPRLRIRSIYPLGLFQAWSYLNFDQRCLVYPQPEGNPALPNMMEFDSDDLIGTKTGVDEFAGFRDYRQGDSMRNMDWRALAREQGPFIKLYQGEGGHRLVLHWDMTQHFNDIEKRLSQLCLWVLQAEEQESLYQLELPGISIDFGQGDQHKHACLKALATYGLTD